MIKCSEETLCDKCGKQLCYVDCFKQCQIEGSYLEGEKRICCECYTGISSSEDDIEEFRRKV